MNNVKMIAFANTHVSLLLWLKRDLSVVWCSIFVGFVGGLMGVDVVKALEYVNFAPLLALRMTFLFMGLPLAESSTYQRKW